MKLLLSILLMTLLVVSIHGCSKTSGSSDRDGALFACEDFCEDQAECLALSEQELINCLNSCTENFGDIPDDEQEDQTDSCYEAVEDFFDCAANAECSDLFDLLPLETSEDLLELEGCQEQGEAVDQICV